MAEAAIGRRMLGEIEETSLDEVWRFLPIRISCCLRPWENPTDYEMGVTWIS